MSSPQQPPAAAAPTPTTITALSDDILREIFLRLPAVTSLARAAFSCHAFLRAVRSSPAFRRRFRDLHAPPVIAFLTIPYMRGLVPAAAGRRGFQFRAFTHLLDDDAASVWRVEADSHSDVPYCKEYVCFTNRATSQWADYSPHSQALKIFPKKPHDGDDIETCLEFHTLSPDGEEHRPSRLVCVHHERSWAWARVAVFSSHTMEWQIFPQTAPLLLAGERNATGTVVSGFVCWVHENEGCILALSTATFQFSRMDLPPPLKFPSSQYRECILSQTKDGRLCIVHVHECNLFVWLWTSDDDGVNRFMLQKMHPLHTLIKEVTERSEVDNVNLQLMTVINGCFVYLSVAYWELQSSNKWFMSFCLQTAEVNLLLKVDVHLPCPVDAYIMTSWPSSLIHNKDSENGVTRGISEDDSLVGTTEETSCVLFTALHSFKEALIDDDSVNFLELDAFLLDDEKNSLIKRITTLESGLANARDRVLRISVDFDDSKGMERGSWWQMCKARLERAWSQLFSSWS